MISLSRITEHKKMHPTVLMILDGWGVPPDIKDKNCPIRPEIVPHYFEWKKKFCYTELEASGEAVGLFKGQEGNSEAGHLNIGAGRVVKQDAVYISEAIEDGTFFKNTAFQQAIHHIKKYNTAAHIMGLMSNHNSAHAVPDHLYALLTLLHNEGITKVYLHLFTDGRDSGPYDARIFLEELRKHMYGPEKIATMMGRFYAMDRNKNWDRIKKAYEALTEGKGIRVAKSAEEALTEAYLADETDEFISPTIIIENGKPIATIQDDDSIFFFNLRSDRARQLTRVFVDPEFEAQNPDGFKRSKILHHIRFVAKTDFGPDLPDVLTAFPSREIHNGLVHALGSLRQLYVAESEKYAHVTFFLHGGFTAHATNERFVKIESDRIVNYRTNPEMKAKEIADYTIEAIKGGHYDFIAINFANADMVGHTGDLQASEIAVKTLDVEIERIIEALLKHNGLGIITADHGNVEEMLNISDHKTEINTEHSINPVPCFIIGSKRDLHSVGIPTSGKLMKKGKLANVTPTILKMMGIEQPKEMTAKPLF
jgi:2,3-bisphosphoglycerate-independent phosphoglycerate mutase